MAAVDHLLNGLESMRAHRLRSALTMLGMGIGVLAVVLLVSLGEGARRYILGEFEGLGSNLIVIQPGKTDERTAFGPPIGSSQRKMSMPDVLALESKALNIDAVTGLILGTVTIKFEENTANVSVFGSNEQFPRIINVKIREGGFFDRDADEFGRRVVVLGGGVAEKLFGEASPLGTRIKLNSSEYSVIGVLARAGDKLGFNLDDFVFIPTSSALRLFNDDKLFGIRARARSRSGLDDAVEEIREILKTRRDGQEDFTIVTQVAMMESMETILSMLTYVLGGIAGISMLVGGIGIMNIMLVNVTERTSEIGIRRAVGATKRDILLQFLIEAVVLSVTAGSVGLGVAVALTYGAGVWYPKFDMTPPTWILVPAFLMSLLTGVIFGILPALRAARVQTLDALRHE